MSDLQTVIDGAYEKRAQLRPGDAPAQVREAVEEALALLDSGEERVAVPVSAGGAQPSDGNGNTADGGGGGSAKEQARVVAAGWRTQEWLKKAVLLSFRLSQNRVTDGGAARFYDKVPLKYSATTAAEFAASGARVVPGAVVRRGAYIAPSAVLMPSFVNIGAHVGGGTMVDAWATVGSCAQIGANVHLSGGVGIGGVLEPLQASPTIIEDGCFIGARSEVVEGAVVGRGSVLAMGVFIGQSTRIYDRESGEVFYGAVPPFSVVVPGSLPSADGKYSLACAVIVKRADKKTRAKTAINDLLRPD